MVERLQMVLSGEAVTLLADRALYWPARQRLIVADLHLGKGAVMRRAGIAVPSGGTRRDLARLTALLDATRADSLWVLGDFLHAARSEGSDAAWQQFRQAHSQLAMAVVPGNHDRALDADAADVKLIPDGTSDGPFNFRHAPGEPDGASGYTLCGHLHPVFKLPAMRAHPLFWIGDRCTVLPAFSLFTGGLRVDRRQVLGSVLCNGRDLLKLE